MDSGDIEDDMAGPTLNLIKTVPEFLKAYPDTKFKPKQIAQAVAAAHPEAAQAKRANSGFTTDGELIARIIREIYSTSNSFLSKHPEIRVPEGKPRLYYWSNESDEEAVAQAEAPAPAPAAHGGTNGGALVSPAESDLHLKLREFLWPTSRSIPCGSMRRPRRTSRARRAITGSSPTSSA